MPTTKGEHHDGEGQPFWRDLGVDADAVLGATRESKGEVVGASGTQPMSQPTDGEPADRAFGQQADPIGPRGSLPPREPGEAAWQSDSRQADAAFKLMGK
jgi:hypothetical protein